MFVRRVLARVVANRASALHVATAAIVATTCQSNASSSGGDDFSSSSGSKSGDIHTAMHRLYDGLPDVHAIPEDEEDAIDASGGHECYGELTVEGTSELLQLVPLARDDVFFDLGSGAGRVIAQIAMQRPEVRAVGIELSQTRHAVACAALERLAPAPHRAAAVHGDILAAPCDGATVVFIAGLLFDDGFMRRLGERLAALPRVRAIATLRPFPADTVARLASLGLEERAGPAQLTCTWAVQRVYVYERRSSGDEPACLVRSSLVTQ